MRNFKTKALSMIVAVVVIASMLAGCGQSASTSTAATGDTATGAASAVSNEAAATGEVPGVDDPALAAKLREEAATYLYADLIQNDPTCTSGLFPPMYESRAAINKAIPEDAGTYKPEDIVIGQQINMLENDWFVEFVVGAEAAAKEYGVKLVTISANGTDEGAYSAVESLITQGCNAIMLNGNSLDVNNALAKKCIEANIMCVGAGIIVGPETGALTSFLTNNFWSAFLNGEIAGQNLEGEHVIAACSLSHWGEPNCESRMAGFVSGVFWHKAQELGLSYTQNECIEQGIEFWQQVRKNGSYASEEFDFEIVNAGESDNTEEGGQTTAENAFTAHSDINLFFTNNDFEGVGITIAARNMGIKLGDGGCYVISANDGNMKALDMVKTGEYLATADGGSYANGYASVALFCEILINGFDASDLIPVTTIPLDPITVDNVEDYYEQGLVLSRGAPPEIVTIPEYNAQQAALLAG